MGNELPKNLRFITGSLPGDIEDRAVMPAGFPRNSPVAAMLIQAYGL
jgi:hypothetical protein